MTKFRLSCFWRTQFKFVNLYFLSLHFCGLCRGETQKEDARARECVRGCWFFSSFFFAGGWGGGQSKFIDKLISAFMNEFAGGFEIFVFCLKNVRHL